MSASEYEEGRLHRENLAEELGRAFHMATADQGRRHGLKPLAPWENLDENVQASIKAAMLDLIDRGHIAPFSVVRQLQIELTNIKTAWKTLRELMEGTT
jgi:hypothetical protein